MKRLWLSISIFLILMGTVGSVLAATYRPGAQGAPSASYEGGSYYEHFEGIPITGNKRKDLIAVALSQLGYQEGDQEGSFSGQASGSHNYVEYNFNPGDLGLGYGGEDYPWCASFVSWCLYQSRCTDQGTYEDMARLHPGEDGYIWKEISCSQWVRQLMETGYYRPSAYEGGGERPRSGDLVFFQKAGRIAHMGICLYTEGDQLYTIEGNTSDSDELVTNGGGVYLKCYPLSSSYIAGYGVLPYEGGEADIDYSGDCPTPGLYISNAVKYLYDSETADRHSGVMNRFTMFQVTEICSNGRLKVIATERGGSTFVGYVKNNRDRVIQVTASAPIHPSDTLYLKGSFNGWDTGLVMDRNPDGSYSTTVYLSPGAHSFKVASADDQQHWPVSNNYTFILETPSRMTVRLNGNVVSISCAEP